MPEYIDPWDTRGRTRASMKPFTGIPWKPPTKRDSSIGVQERKPAEWFGRYKKIMNIRPNTVSHGQGGTGLGQASNFVQTELNPGVAYDKTTKKFRLLLFENGVPSARGSFFTDGDGMRAYSGYYDFTGRGPYGVAGVALSKANTGPPGAAILSGPGGAPQLSVWRMNERARNARATTTALLKEKGQYLDDVPDHARVCFRADLLNNTARAHMHSRPGDRLRGSALTKSLVMEATARLSQAMEEGGEEKEAEAEAEAEE